MFTVNFFNKGNIKYHKVYGKKKSFRIAPLFKWIDLILSLLFNITGGKTNQPPKNKTPALQSLQFSQDFLTFIVLNIELNLMNK